MCNIKRLLLLITLFSSITVMIPIFADNDNQGKFPTGLYEGTLYTPSNIPLVPFIASLYPDGQSQISVISTAQAFPTQGNSEIHFACNRNGNNSFTCLGRQWSCALPIAVTDTPYGASGKCRLRTIPFNYNCTDKSCNTIVGLDCIMSNLLDNNTGVGGTLLPIPPGVPPCVPNLPIIMNKVIIPN